MKIVEIIPSFFPVGGAERFVCDLSIGMANASKEDDFFIISLYNKKGPLVEEIKNTNIKLYFLNKRIGLDLKCAKDLRKILKQIKPDIIHCHLNSLATLYFSRFINKKNRCYFTFHSLVETKSIGSKYKPYNIFLRYLIKIKKIKIIGISEHINLSIRNYFNLSKSKFDIPTINNGINVSKFFNNITWNQRKYDFAFVGRMVPVKNTINIIRAFEKLKKIHADIKIAFVGEGSNLNELMSYVAKKEISNVDILGFQNDVSKILTNAKCLVMSSFYEGNPISINEAIASRCFIISSAVGGIVDIVNKNNGLLFSDPSDVNQLFLLMKSFIENEQSFEEIINQHYKSNCDNVSIDICVKNHLSLFKK